MSRDAVSVIIPTYNRITWLRQAIESVIHQEDVQVEVIVVDDGSDGEGAKTLCNQYQDVIYIYQNNQGLGAARNTGVIASSGEYIQFLDDDDWLTPSAIISKITVLKSTPEIVAVYSDLYLVSENAEILGRFFEGVKRPLPSGDIFSNLVKRNFIPVHALLIRKEVIEHVGGFPTRTGAEDWELLMKLAEKNRFGAIDQPLGYYRLHQGNVSLNLRKQVQGDGRVQQMIITSSRFRQLPRKEQSRLSVSYAWQQWLYGDKDLFEKFFRLAQETDGKSKAVFALRLLTRLGRPFGRTLMQIIWQARSLRRTSAGYYFLTRAKRRELNER